MILLAFAGIALVVATFSIHNTFSILVAQRTRESALLRAIGASRRQVLAAVAGEALVVGVLASAIGFGVGVGLAAGLRALMDGAGFALPGSGLVVGTDTIVIAGVVGVAHDARRQRHAGAAGLAGRAARRPARRRRRPLGGIEAPGRSPGVLLAGAGAARGRDGHLGARTARSPGPGSARWPCSSASSSSAPSSPGRRPRCSAPAPARPVVFTGRLARRNAMRNPRRIAASASALMVGTAVVALFTTFGSSVKASLDDMVDDSFGGDLVVDRSTARAVPASIPTWPPAIGELPEVAGSVGAALVAANVDGHAVEPMATDPAALATFLDLEDRTGSLADVGPGEIADQHPLRRRPRPGPRVDVVPMTFVDGATAELTVGAVFERQDVLGDMIITDADWAPHAGQAMDVVVLVDLADGVSDDGRAGRRRRGDRPLRRPRAADP